MAFCPNPECPHRKKTGKPAEFTDGITNCSDGSHLTEEVAEKSDVLNFALSNFQKKILYTVGLVVLWRILVLIPAPGIDVEALGQFLTQMGGDVLGLPRIFFHVSIFALGIMPYISAYVIIEILSLVVPPLKSWRKTGYEGRAKLKRAALIATFVLGLIQGYGIATGIEAMSDGQFVHHPGWNFRLVLAVTLTCGTFITIWIAELITKNGIGHGISILIITGIAAGFFQRIPSLFSKIDNEIYEHSPFEIFLFVVVLGIALIALVVFAEKSHRRIPVKFDDGKQAYMPLKLTTAGIVPASWAASIVMLPVTIAGFIANPTAQQIARALSPGRPFYFIALLPILFFLYYFFTALFYKPERMAEKLKNKGASFALPERNGEREYIDRILEKMALAGFLYLSIMVLLNGIANYFVNKVMVTRGYTVTIIELAGSGIVLIEMVAIALDLLEEGKMRRKANIVKVAEFHDVPKAGLCKSLLEGQGIQCHLQGYYYRALFYFFGPYIEISALVPEDRAEEAGELINRHIE